MDGRADGRDAGRAVAEGAADDPRAAGQDAGRARRLRKFLERLGEADYGYGWRSYDYAGHHIVGHRGGVSGYRSLILFDPAEEERRGRAVEQQYQPARRARVRSDGHALHLPFRDWMELDTSPIADAARGDDESEARTATQRRARRRRASAFVFSIPSAAEVGQVAEAHAEDRRRHAATAPAYASRLSGLGQAIAPSKKTLTIETR